MTVLSRWLQNVQMSGQSCLVGSTAGSNFPARHISCVVTWHPALHPLQQGHCLQVLNLLTSHKDLVALSHYTPFWSKASAGCKSAEHHCHRCSRAPPTLRKSSRKLASTSHRALLHLSTTVHTSRQHGTHYPACPASPGSKDSSLTSGMSIGHPRYLCALSVAHTSASSS